MEVINQVDSQFPRQATHTVTCGGMERPLSHLDRLLTKLKNYYAHVPNIYGAPKVHKPNCPLRPIVNNRP
ncbi:hypothetical protein LAZ67_2005849 [Cordylochernes scorpioides]|uniref:Uncharacterized protein n=1 Tax=Cordylochernes scorpioides TaxID=51811 RepID=A0ABY6K5P3_9ARAC|nr:hypothetical protein LAZ67_2005849 [Cordylochernes scorpioides]